MFIVRPFYIQKDFLCLDNVVVGVKSFDLPLSKMLFVEKAEKVLERLKKFFFYCQGSKRPKMFQKGRKSLVVSRFWWY
jgi:hypothetical protein